jgi:hypothetical protein
MVYDLFPGDVIHIGTALKLTIVAVEDNLVRLGLEAPEGENADAVGICLKAHAEKGSWTLN